MRIERLGRLALSILPILLTFTASVAGQEGAAPPLVAVDADTRVGSVGFRFLSPSDLTEERLRDGIALKGPGALAGLQDAFAFLPGIAPAAHADFSPLTLQRDVARLRRSYREAGYPDVGLDYEVRLDTATNRVDVTFLVDAGEPVRVDTVEVRYGVTGSATTGPSGPPAPELEAAWRDEREALAQYSGRRFGTELRSELNARTIDWLRSRGYPWAEVSVTGRDTLDHRVVVALDVEAGARARVDSVLIEGREALSEGTVRRELTVRPGAWYDASSMSESERQLYEIDLVRRALGDLVPEQPRDSTASVRFRVEEAPPRLVWGRLGWRSESGMAGEAHWSHRNFFGGARTLTASVTGETGWAALEEARGRSLGVSAVVRQPHVVHRDVSASAGPFVRVRDDFRDRSVLFGVESALLWQDGPLRNVTLQHEFSRLRVDDALDLGPVADIVQNGSDAFAPLFTKSILKLSASLGQLDDRIDPRRGVLLQPTVQVTTPGSQVEFFRAGAEVFAAVPFGARTGVSVRASAGRLLPFGASDPAGGDRRALIGLRGVMFTAGGTGDLRGWGTGSLGPKIPDISTGTGGRVEAGRYLPVGGSARLTAGVELGLPLPFLGPPHGTYVFLDAGRVWSPGGSFRPEDPELDVDGWGFGVGGGVQVGTPVGPVRLGVGYKLNPSPVDLRSAGDVARALAAGRDLSSVPPDTSRRWHLHLSIGRGL